MKRTIETSELIKHRIKYSVPARMIKMEQAIIQKDFRTFAEHTMKDSNQMHAVCLDAYPPCVYMNDISLAVTDLVHSYNEAIGDTKVMIESTTFIKFSYSAKFQLNMYFSFRLHIPLMPDQMQLCIY